MKEKKKYILALKTLEEYKTASADQRAAWQQEISLNYPKMINYAAAIDAAARSETQVQRKSETIKSN